MHLFHLTCQTFRCLREVDIAPCPAMNIIQGDNAQGKTSLLEAVLFVATSKSHRTTVETDLVQHGAEGFRVEAKAHRRDRDVVLEVARHQGAKRIKVNRIAQTRVSDILGNINVVLFSPEDVTLVKGAASVAAEVHRYGVGRSWTGATLTRSSATGMRCGSGMRCFGAGGVVVRKCWRCAEAQLAQYGAVIVAARAAFVEGLSVHAAEVYGRVAQAEGVGGCVSAGCAGGRLAGGGSGADAGSGHQVAGDVAGAASGRSDVCAGRAGGEELRVAGAAADGRGGAENSGNGAGGGAHGGTARVVAG